jgi:hypothetical protein
VPAEQVHVVTLPQAGASAGELWSRFATVLGIDGALFDASGRGSNESLGRESTDLMLRLNEVARANEVDWATYEDMFKRALAKRGLSKRRHVESPPRRLPPELQEWAKARTAEQIRAVQASGAHVVGDLAELEPVLFAVADEVETGTEGVLAAALEGLVALAKDREAEIERLRRRVEQLQRKRPAPSDRPRGGVPRRLLHRAYRSGNAAMRRVRRQA